MLTPTDETYAELQVAYAHFNDRLFGGTLPGCLFTLQRKANTFGYYSRARFLRRDASGKTDEIAMNPAYFAFRPIEVTLSTLVHEMVHQWQLHHSKPSRKGYHNKEWADKMESIGLMPSATGEPGGARVGQRMTHYLIEGGPFDIAAKELLEAGRMISWVDVDAKKVPMQLPAGADGEDPTPPGLDVGALTALGLSTGEPTKRSKIKYTCPTCEAKAWGKPELNLVCGDCHEQLVSNTHHDADAAVGGQ